MVWQVGSRTYPTLISFVWHHQSANVKGLGCDFPPSAKRKLCDKKQSVVLSLSWLDLLSKCWSALTCSWSALQCWNSTLEWGLVASKNLQKDKEAGLANRLIQQSGPYANCSSRKNEPCLYILSTQSPPLYRRMPFNYAFSNNNINGWKFILDIWMLKEYAPLPEFLLLHKSQDQCGQVESTHSRWTRGHEDHKTNR